VAEQKMKFCVGARTGGPRGYCWALKKQNEDTLLVPSNTVLAGIKVIFHAGREDKETINFGRHRDADDPANLGELPQSTSASELTDQARRATGTQNDTPDTARPGCRVRYRITPRGRRRGQDRQRLASGRAGVLIR
jgi:hypothetical protein